MKTCRTCQRDLPDSAYRMGRRALRPDCRSCEAARMRVWRLAHPTYNRDWLRAYRAAHPNLRNEANKRRAFAAILAKVGK